jgi:hypothetical protein
VLPHERPLVTDAQLRMASVDQIEDLVQRLNLVLQERRWPGQLVWQRTSEGRAGEDYPARSDPFDPPTI